MAPGDADGRSDPDRRASSCVRRPACGGYAVPPVGPHWAQPPPPV